MLAPKIQNFLLCLVLWYFCLLFCVRNWALLLNKSKHPADGHTSTSVNRKDETDFCVFWVCSDFSHCLSSVCFGPWCPSSSCIGSLQSHGQCGYEPLWAHLLRQLWKHPNQCQRCQKKVCFLLYQVILFKKVFPLYSVHLWKNGICGFWLFSPVITLIV